MTAQARVDALARERHRGELCATRHHTATVIDALPETQRRQTRSDLHRFDARLTRLTAGGANEPDRTNSARRQQALLQRLFNLRLSNNCFVKRRLDALGLDAVVASLSQVCSRYGMRLLTLDDFHLALSEALPKYAGESVTHAETRLLFGLFDDDRSGIVDLEEFAEGLQLLLLNESVVLLAHCRAVVCDTHPPADAMASALEVDLMFGAVERHYDECVAKSARERRKRPPAWIARLRAEAARVKAELWKDAHKGQIHVAALQSAVRSAVTLEQAIIDLPENGIRDDGFDGDDARSGPGTPEPDAVFAEMARLAKRRGDDDDGSGGAGDGGDDDNGGRRGITYEFINVRNNQFRADEWKAPDERRQLSADEHGCPLWYCRGGQVWRVRDGEAPEPVLDL